MTTARKIFIMALSLLITGTFSATAQEQPDLRMVNETVDFGCVGVDFMIFGDYQMVNYGTDTIRIDTVTGHCDCTDVRFRDSLVAPGDTASFRIIFNTANFYGLVEKDVRIHSSDAKSPKLYGYYRAIIGQWAMSIEPDPVSVFFLPTKKTKISRLINHSLDEIKVANIEILDDFFRIEKLKDEASKGEAIELELIPNPDLAATTHRTNFTVTLDLPEDLPHVRVTIPVKIVRY
jgi:hypothetical protein